MSAGHERPPSVDTLARQLAGDVAIDLPHPLLVDVARAAIADGGRLPEATQMAVALQRSLLTPVVNATGVLLHTNLGRAPLAHHQPARAQTVEFDLATGERGSRQRAVGQLFARLCGTEDAIVVNNNASAVLLVVAALAAGRDVAVSRGESVEIGGAFRVPEVMAQSGARLVDVGTTNRTRLADYAGAIADERNDIAVVMKIHPSNFRVEGFVEETSVAELATLDVPVVADIGSGLLDANVPWMHGPPPAWLAGEPAAVQTVAEGADLVTFSCDKLLGGPQAGVIAGSRDLVARCARHPLMRALRCGGLVLAALQDAALSYLHRTVTDDIAFWQMVAAPLDELRQRADAIVEAVADETADASTSASAGSSTGGSTGRSPGGSTGGSTGEPDDEPADRPADRPAGRAGVTVVETKALPGAGSAPGVVMPSVGLSIAGDRLAELRSHTPPVIARTRDGRTVLDLRSVDPADDTVVADAIRRALGAR